MARDNTDQGLSPVALDHAQRPRNNGPPAEFTHHARITGPCGDTMEFWLFVQDGRIGKAAFVTDGCGPSHACGSVATCLAEGKTVEQSAAITQQDILDALGGLPESHRHCALLAANTLKTACEDGPDAQTAIRHKILVLSGKGGVGKSSVAVNLAVWLSAGGRQVGLLDADIHGPSVPKLLAVHNERATAELDRILPIEYRDRLKVMSIGFLLPDENQAVIWRGPMKHSLIQQFVQNVDWGRLDCLVVDCPPGTGDEPLSVVQTLGGIDGAVIVTTPQEVAAIDVRKCITFCRQLGLRVLGIIENMSGFVCPHCGKRSDIFAGQSGREMAEDFKVPFLGSIPIDPALAAAADRGKPFVNLDPDNPTAQAMRHAFQPLLDLCEPRDVTETREKRAEQ
jgi:ATP-binding protein involved in chromosome partitioning